MSTLSPTRENTLRTDVLVVAAWCGLATGFIEALIFLIQQRFGKLMQVSIEIVWIAALFDLLLFCLVGVGLIAVARFVPRLVTVTSAVRVFAFLAFADWLAVALPRRVHVYAIVSLALGLAVQTARWCRSREAALARFWRRSVAALLATAALALIAIQGGLWLTERYAIAALPAAAPNVPNILVIVVDTLRADHLSSYGYARATTPHIDRVAQQGVLFETAFATTSWTLPSHVSLLTGRYPYEHGIDWHTPTALRHLRDPVLAEVLRGRGYRTAAFSANLFWVTREAGFGRGFIHFEDYCQSVYDMILRTVYGRALEKFALRRLGFEDIPARKRAADINRSLLRWVERDRGRPFFAFLNYLDTHDPYLPPQPYRSRFSKLENPGGILNGHVGREDPPMTPEQAQGEIDAYDGAVAYVDDQIGALLAALQQRGLGDNTLLVITSDHGEAFGEHGLFLHVYSLYREMIQVPLIFWQLGHVPAGVRVSRPVSNAALPATIMDLIGADASFPGPSLRRLWEGEPADSEWPDPLTELAQHPWAPKRSPAYHGSMKSLVGADGHYIVNEALGAELFDWRNDPREARNLVDAPQMQDVVAGFRAKLLRFTPEGHAVARAPRPEVVTADGREDQAPDHHPR